MISSGRRDLTGVRAATLGALGGAVLMMCYTTPTCAETLPDTGRHQNSTADVSSMGLKPGPALPIGVEAYACLIWLRELAVSTSSMPIWCMAEVFEALCIKASWLVSLPGGPLESVAAAIAAIVIAANTAVLSVYGYGKLGSAHGLASPMRGLARVGSGFLPRVSSWQSTASLGHVSATPAPYKSSGSPSNESECCFSRNSRRSRVSFPSEIQPADQEGSDWQEGAFAAAPCAPVPSTPPSSPVLRLASSGLRFVRRSVEASAALELFQQRKQGGASSPVRGGGSMPRVPSGQQLMLEANEQLRDVPSASDASPPRGASCTIPSVWQSGVFTDKDMDEVQRELAQAPSEEIPENSPWTVLLVKSMPNLTYTVWKRPFKNGLNEFKSTMEISGVTAKQVYDFQSDDVHRCKWDDNIQEFTLLGRSPDNDFVELQYWRSKFPRPLAHREYVFVKQNWIDEQGACYSVSKSVDMPSATPSTPGRLYRVSDYYVATKIVDVTQPGDAAPTTRLVQWCHEDNGVSAGMINMTLRRGLWGFVQTQHKALGAFVHSPPRYAPRALPPPRGAALACVAGAASAQSAPPKSASQMLFEQTNVVDFVNCVRDSGLKVMQDAIHDAKEAADAIRKRISMDGRPSQTTGDSAEGIADGFWTPGRLLAQVGSHGSHLLLKIGCWRPLGSDKRGRRVRKRDLMQKEMERVMGRARAVKGTVKQRMYGVWQRMHLSSPSNTSKARGPGAAAESKRASRLAAIASPGRWIQSLRRRRREKMQQVRNQGHEFLASFQQRRQIWRRRASMILMPLALMLKTSNKGSLK